MNAEKNIKTLIVKKPLKLDCGKTIKDFPIAYETYGSLNSKKDNAILVCLLYTSPSPRDRQKSRMPSSA